MKIIQKEWRIQTKCLSGQKNATTPKVETTKAWNNCNKDQDNSWSGVI